VAKEHEIELNREIFLARFGTNACSSWSLAGARRWPDTLGPCGKKKKNLKRCWARCCCCARVARSLARVVLAGLARCLSWPGRFSFFFSLFILF
jgi:hypothetical protein